ncbi:MAG: hypothetical protein DRI48_09040, partial [Chloroflexi bacterium]
MGPPIEGVACSSDGKRIAILSGDGGLRVMDRVHEDILDVLAIPSKYDLSSFYNAQLGYGTMLFCSGQHNLIWGDQYGRAHVFDVDRGIPVQTLPPPGMKSPSSLLDVFSSPNGCVAASTNGEDRIVIWDMNTKSVLHVLQSVGLVGVKRAKFSPQGTFLASVLSQGFYDGRVVVWDVATSSVLWETTMDAWVETVAFSPNGRLLLTSSF